MVGELDSKLSQVEGKGEGAGGLVVEVTGHVVALAHVLEDRDFY